MYHKLTRSGCLLCVYLILTLNVVLYWLLGQKIWVGIWKQKIASPFRHAVDFKTFPNYGDFVTKPICLLDIRDNIGE